MLSLTPFSLSSYWSPSLSSLSTLSLSLLVRRTPPNPSQVFCDGVRNNAQHDVFEQTKRLVRSATDGFNACVFAYGQTGSGKTYTMLGPNALTAGPTTPAGGVSGELSKTEGLAFRCYSELFALRAAAHEVGLERWTISVTVLELYRDSLHDLLAAAGAQNAVASVASPTSGADGRGEGAGAGGQLRRPLSVQTSLGSGGSGSSSGSSHSSDAARLIVRMQKDGSVDVEGATRRTVTSAAELRGVLRQAASMRHTAHTEMNMSSSRSHLLQTVHIEVSQPRGSGAQTSRAAQRRQQQAAAAAASPGGTQLVLVRRGKLTLVDLAGSERAKRTGTSGSGAGDSAAGAERLKEAQSINKSLSALGNVINALTSGA